MMCPYYSDYGGRSAVRLRRSCFAVDQQPTIRRNGSVCPLRGQQRLLMDHWSGASGAC
jgi:hypothetical protein